MSSVGTVPQKDIVLHKGIALSPEFTYKIDGVAQDISSDGLTFSVIEDPEEASPLFTRMNTTAGGDDTQIEWITDGTNGQFYVHFISTNTSTLELGTYYWQLKITTGGKDFIIGEGKIFLKESW